MKIDELYQHCLSLLQMHLGRQADEIGVWLACCPFGGRGWAVTVHSDYRQWECNKLAETPEEVLVWLETKAVPFVRFSLKCERSEA